MTFRTLGLAFLLISTVSHAQGRKPAVEEFVGIEVDEANAIPQGNESLYNLEQDITNLKTVESRPVKAPVTPTFAAEETSWSSSTLFGISLIAGLPLMIWLLVMSHLKKKATVESASNIEVLEKYRKERERKMENNIKKAS